MISIALIAGAAWGRFETNGIHLICTLIADVAIAWAVFGGC